MQRGKKKIGSIIVPPGVFIDRYEKMAADYLATHLGYDIEFLLPNRQRGARTPDITMDGKKWEIKNPRGKSSRTIENSLRQARKQSANIILDLRRTDGRIPTRKFLHEIKRQFGIDTSMKHILVITREERHIDFLR